MREGEHAVEVRHRESLLSPLLQPVLLGERLAFGTVAIAAGAVRRSLPPIYIQ